VLLVCTTTLQQPWIGYSHTDSAPTLLMMNLVRSAYQT